MYYLFIDRFYFLKKKDILPSLIADFLYFKCENMMASPVFVPRGKKLIHFTKGQDIKNICGLNIYGPLFH